MKIGSDGTQAALGQYSGGTVSKITFEDSSAASVLPECHLSAAWVPSEPSSLTEDNYQRSLIAISIAISVPKIVCIQYFGTVYKTGFVQKIYLNSLTYLIEDDLLLQQLWQ